MRAIIMKHPVSPRHSLLPIAGQTLLGRQLEWLRGQGITDVALDLSPSDVAVAEWLDTNFELSRNVVRVESAKYMRSDDVAARAGFPRDEPYVVVMGDLLVAAPLSAILLAHGRTSMTVSLRGRGDMLDGMLRIVVPGSPSRCVHAPLGWGCFILHHGDALEVSAMLLRGCTSDLVVHGSEVAPGVWAARGAVIERGAVVRPGVLLGPGVIVCAGATVGPDVIVGANTVIESDVRLSNAVVDARLTVNHLAVHYGRIARSGVHHLQSDELLEHLGAAPAREAA